MCVLKSESVRVPSILEKDKNFFFCLIICEGDLNS